MTTFYAGQPLTAALMEQFVPLFVQKGSDETVTSSSTLQTDDELIIPGVPTGTWELDGKLWVLGASGSNQDFKFSFSFPTGTIEWSGHGYHANWANADGSRDYNAEGELQATSSLANARGFGTVTSTNVPILVDGLLVSTESGDLSLSWAQNTSNATGTTLKAGSWLRLRKAVITS